MKENKPIIVQQVLDPQRGGGVTTEFTSLMNSELIEKYVFLPMIIKNVHKGINLRDIMFYYKFLKKERYDIVHIRGAGIDSLNAIIAAKILKKGKILTTIHGLYSDLVYISKFKKAIARKIIEPLIFKMSDYLSCVYQGCSSRGIFKKNKHKLLPHVYNRYPNISVSDDVVSMLRIKYNICDDDFVYIYVGRLSREKGLEYFVEAIEKLCRDGGFKGKFLILGDGPYRKNIEEKLFELINKKIVLLVGTVDNIYDFLAFSNVFVNPSLHENHSIAILEALISKIPSIVTNTGGNVESIIDNYNGMIVEPFSTESILSAMKKIFYDVNLYEKLKNNLNDIDDRFSSKSVDKMLDEVYKKILES